MLKVILKMKKGQVDADIDKLAARGIINAYIGVTQ